MRAKHRVHRWGMIVGLLILILILAACSDEDPANSDEAPVLLGFEAMPKQIATVALTPTPSPVFADGGGEPVNVAASTPEPGPVLPTPTLTPYVGVFLGEPTSASGDVAPTIAPWIINPVAGAPAVNAGGGISPASGATGSCSISVMPQLANAYNANPDVQTRLGCPLSVGVSERIVTQPFERGNMYWREVRQIYALANNGQMWQVPDGWTDGQPNDDPNRVPPSGLLQPVRGFGKVWRENPAIETALGWATLPEADYAGAGWQDFEGGVLFLGANNQVYAIYTAEGRHSGPLGS